jgi:hypothetical protein
MRFVRPVRLILILSCCLVLATCSGPIRITFINNTSLPLQIFSGEQEQFELGRGESIMKTIPYAILHSFIIKRDRNYFYAFPSALDIPGKFYKLGLRNGIKLQIEESMRVYLLLPDQDGPTSDLPDQPQGFPVIPTQ